MTEYEFWYADELGNRLSYIDWVTSFEYVKVVGDIGVGVFNVPRIGRYYESVDVDKRIHVYRQPTGGSLSLDFVCLLQLFNYNTSETNSSSVKLRGQDLNTLLERKIVGFRSETTQSSKTAPVDDMMKEIVTEQLLSGTYYYGTFLKRIVPGLTVQPDSSLGPTFTKQFAYKNVLKILKELQAGSKASGNEVFFAIIPETPTSMNFRTYTGQPGYDRTGTVFSLEYGNLVNPDLKYDYSTARDYATAGGRGQDEDRHLGSKSGNGFLMSPLGSREVFTNATQYTATADLQSSAGDTLARRRPKKILTATLTDSPTARYGRDWNVGDKVTINYADVQSTTIIRSVHVSVSENGKETIAARVELDV